ncbi:MAG: SDR family oxidoreductase [Dehalococcoidales bacterium]|jgi:uncharacterized oxidoreductase
MNIKGNTILITGGATGIGYALAEALVKAGNKVIICGRRQARLKEAKANLPGLETRVCDITSEKERASLFNWIKENFKSTNILINNAGIQRMVNLKEGTKGRFNGKDEIATNLYALIRLSEYFTPLLLKQKEAAIVNVSSGLGFIPIAAMPVYCATKAAVHSFTVSMRHQLKDTPIKVFEIIPPAVQTELGGVDGEAGDSYGGIQPAELAAEFLPALAKDQYEIPVGEAKGLVQGSKTNFEQLFQNLNNWE